MFLKKQKDFLKNMNVFRIVLTMLSTFSILCIIGLAFFSWKWADDYTHFNAMAGKSPLQYGIWMYMNWDGRGFFQGIILGVFLKYFSVEITNAFWASNLIFTAFIIVKMLILEFPFLNKQKLTNIISIALISITLWLGMWIHIKETVYWATGGFYILSVNFGLIWFYLFFLLRRDRIGELNIFYIFSLFIFSVISGMLSHNLSTGLLGLGIFFLFAGYTAKKDKNFWASLLMLFGCLIGAIIISVAPGNFIRTQYGKNSFDLNILSMALNYIKVFLNYLSISGVLILTSFLSGFILTFLSYTKKVSLRKEFILEFKTKIIKMNFSIIARFLNNFKYLIAALFTIIPFVLIPDFSNDRASIYFMIFLLLFIICLMIKLTSFLFFIKDESSNIVKTPTFINILMMMIFILFIALVSSHMVVANKIRKKILNREKILLENKNSRRDLVLKKLKINKVPFSLEFNEFSMKADDWINIGVANYYGLKSVTVDKK